jgi:hypothetical protein
VRRIPDLKTLGRETKPGIVDGIDIGTVNWRDHAAIKKVLVPDYDLPSGGIADKVASTTATGNLLPISRLSRYSLAV